MDSHNCKQCCALFIKRVHNSKYCSDSCRKIANNHKKKNWHLKNKTSENAKSRLRISKYSVDEKKQIYNHYRINNGLPMLLDKICIVCTSIFKAQSHNSLSCSKECSKLLGCNRSRESFKNRYKSDALFKLRSNLRNRMNKAIKNNQKSGSAVSDLGCSISELKKYIESLFKPGMTWENWSKTGWHIDHIRPLSSFNLSDPEQFKEACHYTNLQPLWAKDNLSKSSKIL